MGRGRLRYAAIASGLAVLLYGTPASVGAEGNAGLHLHKAVDPFQLTIAPAIGVTLGVDKSSAIPGDTLTYTAVVSNPTATLGMGGYINAQAVASTDANVAYYWDELEYCAQGCGTGAANPNWTALAAFEAGQAGYQPVTTPALHTGMSLAATSVTRSGVTYPTGGDPILGTQISPSATATWTYRATVVLTPAQIALLSNPALTKAVRNVLHFEVTERNTTAAQPYTDPESFDNPFASAPNPGAISNLTVTFTLPDGTTVVVGPAQVPALALLNPGGTATATAQFKVPVPAPRGAGEAEVGYLARLLSLNGLLLRATALAAGSGFSGTVYATSAPVFTQENVPIVTIAKSGPAVVNAGEAETNPLALQNVGGAAGASLSVVDTVPAGGSGTVMGAPASLGAGASASATASYPVPISQAGGDLTDTASVVWKDGNGNPYGPLSSSFTTLVHNVLFGARLTLAPASAGPNSPGSTQTLTATLVDSHGSPIANQVVTFTVTGANPGSGTGTTDAAGSTSFTYAGANTGNDVVQATVTAPGITISSNTSLISWLTVLQPVVTSAVQGNFYANQANSCTFDIGQGSTPVFGQTFPDILFNPAAGVVPHNISTVTNFTRPFTDLTVDVNGNYNGQIVAQGNGQQAGTGPLVNFYGEFTGSFVVNQPGDLTFRILHDDGYILGVGGGATRVNGDLEGNPPATTPFNGYGVVAAWNTGSSGSSSSGPATVHFPAAGTYPYELDYTECGAGALFLNLLTEQFVAQTNPLAVYVGYADALRPSGSAFPFPWDGSPNTNFSGCRGCSYDAGAVRFDNTSSSPMTFDSITVDVGPNHFDLWPHGITLPPGQLLIITQTTTNENFDTSDLSPTPCFVNDNVIPKVNVTVAGTTTTFSDVNQILNTGGFDLACLRNESLPWRSISGGGTAINLPLPPAATLNLTPFNVPNAIQGQSITLTVAALDGAGNPAANLPVTLQVSGANPQTLNKSTDTAGLVAFTYPGNLAGADTVEASAFVGGLRAISNTAIVVWIPPGGSTNNPLGPSIGSQSPADGSIITKPVPVDASIAPPSGHSITGWRVFYQAANGGAAVVIGGRSGVPPSPLGVTFDPTLLTDGSYLLTVEATADNGAIQDLSSGISVIGSLKVGRYSTSVQDLSASVNGFQMQVLRTYDSTDPSAGDFGVGWQVDVSNFRVSANRTLGAGGWTQYNKSCTLGLCFTAFKNTAPRFVTVIFPDQHWEIFDFVPDGGTNIFWSCTPLFKARASVGTTSTLIPLDDTGCSYSGDGNIYGSSGVYNPQRFKLTTHSGQVFVIDHAHGLISLTDRNGNSLAVDAAGVHASNGQSITFVRDGSGRITAATGPSGESLQYAYTPSGDLASSKDPNGNLTAYTYDGSHHLLSASMNGGALRLQTQEYDSRGRLVAITDGAGNRIVISNSVPGQTIAMTDTLGSLTTVTHMDDLGDVVQTDQVSGGQTLTTAFTYDSTGRLLSRGDPLGQTTSLAYDVQGNATAYTDSNGRTSHFAYDSFGYLTSAVASDGTVLATVTYDSTGRPTQLQGADGSTKTFVYDSAGRVTSVTDSLGRAVNMTYDSNGHAASMTDSGGGTTSMTNDASGKLLSVTDPAGSKITFTYDADGNLLSIKDPSGHTQSNSYDAFGRTLTSTDASGKSNTYTYDATGRLTSVVDRRGNTTSFNYDVDGNLVKGTYPGGDITNFAYDGFGRLTNMSNATSSLASTYDSQSRIVTQTETLPVVGAVTNSYTYDAVGNRASMTSVDGTTHYTYDARDRLVSMTDPLGGSFAFNYNARSQLAAISRPNGVVDSFTYDSAGKMTSRTATRSGATVALSSQTFNSAGEVASRTDLNGTTTYVHDSTGQVVGVTAPGASASSYVYDAAGNRVSDPVSSSMTYDPANRLLSDSNFTYTYDSEGNRTSRTNRSTGAVTNYTYNGHGQLASVQNPDGTTTSFTYDVLGRRVQVASGAQTTTYAYDGANIHLEYGGTSLVASYTDPLSVDNPLEMRRGGQSYYYLSDVAGNVTGLSDASGSPAATYSYDAFGVPASSTGTVANPFTYAGRELESKSGLYYNRARYYEPTTGRFLSEDPAPSVNGYPYVRNDPVDFNDPTGAGPIWEYIVNTFQATRSQRFIGCAMAAFAVGLEYIVGFAFKGKIDFGPLVVNGITACAFGAVLPGVGPTSTAAQFGWFIFIIPILLALVVALIDVVQQLGCVNAQHPYDPAHTMVVFTLAFAIAHYFGIWGAAAGALKGAASVAAATATGVATGGASGLGDQVPGGACG